MCKLQVVWAILRETFCVFVREELENKKCACVGAWVHMRQRENFVCKYMCVYVCMNICTDSPIPSCFLPTILLITHLTICSVVIWHTPLCYFLWFVRKIGGMIIHFCGFICFIWHDSLWPTLLSDVGMALHSVNRHYVAVYACVCVCECECVCVRKRVYVFVWVCVEIAFFQLW